MDCDSTRVEVDDKEEEEEEYDGILLISIFPQHIRFDHVWSSNELIWLNCGPLLNGSFSVGDYITGGMDGIVQIVEAECLLPRIRI